MPKQDFNARNKKPPRFFPKGSLVFSKSDHALTIDKDYYVCAKRQKRQCNHAKETRIKREVLERAFSRLAMKFVIPNTDENLHVFDRYILGKVLHTLVDEIIEQPRNTEYFDSTLAVIKEDVEFGDKKQFKEDMRDIKGAYTAKLRQDDILPITTLLLGTSLTFLRPDVSEIQMGRIIAFLSKKIYLSDSGKIEKIELTKLGSYIIQYIGKYIPEYTKSLNHLLIGTINFESFEFKDIAKKIRRSEIENMLPYDPFNTTYSITLFTKLFFSKIHTLDMKDIAQYLEVMGSSFEVDTLIAMTRILGTFNTTKPL